MCCLLMYLKSLLHDFSGLESSPDPKPTSFYSISIDTGTGSISRKAVLHFATSQIRKSQNYCKIAQPLPGL